LYWRKFAGLVHYELMKRARDGCVTHSIACSIEHLLDDVALGAKEEEVALASIMAAITPSFDDRASA
jgi:hypothetical protein